MAVWTTPHDFVALEVPTADELDAWISQNLLYLYDQLHTITAYTPTLTASTTDPTLGSGSSAVGSYVQMGRLVTYRAWVSFGTSGTAAGSGGYRVSLPVPAEAGWEGTVIGNVELNNSGTALFRTARIATGGTYTLMFAEDGTAVTDSVPFAWGVSDYLRVSGSYFSAS